MAEIPGPSGRSRGRSNAAAFLVWPALYSLLIVAAICGHLALRGQPLVSPFESLRADGEIAHFQTSLAAPYYEVPPPAPPASRDREPDRDPDLRPPPAPPAAGEPYDVALELQKGDTLDGMLRDIGVPPDDRAAIVAELAKFLKKTRLAPGETVQLTLQADPEAPDAPRVLSLLVRPRPEREYSVTREADGGYSGEEKVYEVEPRIVRVAAERSDSLMESGLRAGAPAAAIREFIKALSYGVDFQRELRRGQAFSLLLEQSVTSDGKVVHDGRLLAGRLDLGRRSVTVIAYRPRNGARQFYTPEGVSVVRAFLRTPMDATHISSRFGMRRHPILGFTAMHAGVDFAAPFGTPVLAAGLGRVTMAGRRGGYGLYVELRHSAEIATAYAHMSRLGPGIRRGVRVRQGQVIGFVGSTGLSTGPHLHYEFHRRGRPVNPLIQHASLRQKLTGRDLSLFRALVRRYLAKFRTAPLLAAEK